MKLVVTATQAIGNRRSSAASNDGRVEKSVLLASATGSQEDAPSGVRRSTARDSATQRIVFNGREYASPAELPRHVRQMLARLQPADPPTGFHWSSGMSVSGPGGGDTTFTSRRSTSAGGASIADLVTMMIVVVVAFWLSGFRPDQMFH